MHRALFAVAAWILAACQSAAPVPDPNPSWHMSTPELHLRVYAILEPLYGTQVVSRAPPFDGPQPWRFAFFGYGYLSDDADVGIGAMFVRADAREEEDRSGFEFRIHVRSLGDIGDLYERITGRRHPELSGPVTAFYRYRLQHPLWWSPRP